LTEHLVGKLLAAGEMGLSEVLLEIRSFEAAPRYSGSASADAGHKLRQFSAS
jgi:hypothetical protein